MSTESTNWLKTEVGPSYQKDYKQIWVTESYTKLHLYINVKSQSQDNKTDLYLCN